jgi:hypothetical protein
MVSNKIVLELILDFKLAKMHSLVITHDTAIVLSDIVGNSGV